MRPVVITALVAASIIIGPSFAFGQGASVDVSAQAGINATTTRPGFPKLGPAIKQVASTTRGALLNTASSTREGVEQRVGAIHDLIEQHKQAIAERKATLLLRVEGAKTKARAKFNERIQANVDALVDKLSEITYRLSYAADRLDTHIERLESEGKDMTLATELMVEARASITVATEKAAAASAALDTALAASSPKTEMEKVRTAVAEAQAAIRTAHQDLKEVFVAIRAATSATVEADASVN